VNPKPEARAVSPLWWQPMRCLGVLGVAAYYHSAYRIRGWGRLPLKRGPTLLVINHQHDIESAVIVATLSVTGLAWRYPIYTVSSRRMWEPDFMAQRIPWIRPLVRGLNFGLLFSWMGMQPIENELHSKPLLSMAHFLFQLSGDVLLTSVFRERVLQALPSGITMLSDLLKPANSAAAEAIVTLSDLREPYRSQALRATREQLEADSNNFEALVRAGATLFLAPEGFYSTDGKMQRMRGLLPRLAPLARIWLGGISYDPFLGKRLSMLYRVAVADATTPLHIQLKRLRPVTVSALLAAWLHDRSGSFTEDEALDAVKAQLRELPPPLFVEPELRKQPQRLVHAALQRMTSLGMLRSFEDRYELTGRRMHPAFSRTPDMIAYQANFHQETLEGARYGAGKEPSACSA